MRKKEKLVLGVLEGKQKLGRVKTKWISKYSNGLNKQEWSRRRHETDVVDSRIYGGEKVMLDNN